MFLRLSYLPNALFKGGKNQLGGLFNPLFPNVCPAFLSKSIFVPGSFAATLSTAFYWETVMFYGFI